MGGHRRARKCLKMLLSIMLLNKTGRINYNKGGVKDDVGFQPCSDKFEDSFILRVLVADYLIHKKSYVEVGSINRTTRAMLERNGLETCKVKAISLPNANGIPAESLTKMPFQIEEKECETTEYYLQDSICQCGLWDSIAISKDKGVLGMRTFS